MGDLKTLAARMNRIAESLDDGLAQLKADVATAIIADLIRNTPVDTSRALSNWRVSTGAVLGPIGPLVPGSGGSSQAASVGAAIGAASAAIVAGKTNQALVIFNSLPYIQRLNEGSSAQAPAGFVERAILIGRSMVRAYKLRLAQ